MTQYLMVYVDAEMHAGEFADEHQVVLTEADSIEEAQLNMREYVIEHDNSYFYDAGWSEFLRVGHTAEAFERNIYEFFGNAEWAELYLQHRDAGRESDVTFPKPMLRFMYDYYRENGGEWYVPFKLSELPMAP